MPLDSYITHINLQQLHLKQLDQNISLRASAIVLALKSRNTLNVNPFHSKEWKSDCENQFKKPTLSGVGTHHQNHAERSIQTIINMSRAMLLHFAIHWPQQANTKLWPFAIDQAVYLWNQIPEVKNKISPLEHFTQTAVC